MRQGASKPEQLLFGVWQNKDSKNDIARFTFGKIQKGHCKATRIYAGTVDAGDCTVDAAKHSFTFVISGAEDDPETFSFTRNGATLVLQAEAWGKLTFTLVPNADVAAELAKRE